MRRAHRFLKVSGPRRSRATLGATMHYDLEMIVQACNESDLVAKRMQASVEIDLGRGAVLCFQNSEKEQDCLVGFRETPWHTHGDFTFVDPRGHFAEMDYLGVLYGLAEGTVLVCERHTNGHLADRWLIHKDYADEFGYMDESDQIIVWRAKKRKSVASSESA